MTLRPPYRLSTEDAPTVEAARVLLCVDHGTPYPDGPDAEAWRVRAGLPLLAGPRCEWWLSDSAVGDLGGDGVAFRANSTIGFGHLAIDETALAADTAGACRDAFERLIGVIRGTGYPHLLRCWIYIGHIHRGDGDDERYRQFCVGRARALDAIARDPRDYPAATVIGRPVDGASIHFMAARSPAQAIENPRQTSAFDYPRRYGPQPPSFVRSLRTDWGALLVSGTAAVVGADSLHPCDAGEQARETRGNIDALLHAAGNRWQNGRAVIYLRRAEDLAAAERLGLSGAITVLQGDICRPELMIECEGVFRLA